MGRPDTGTANLPASEDDWYANLLWIEGRKCLLVTHAGTLLSVFVPDVRARDVRPLGTFVVSRIHDQLAAERYPSDVLGVLDPSDARIAKTADRSVIGCMNDLTLTCEYAVADTGGLPQLDLLGSTVDSSATSPAPAATSQLSTSWLDGNGHHTQPE